jgi:hypothetical protein
MASSNNNGNSNDKSVEAFVNAGLREDLIEKAIGFLTHPKVADTALSRKRDFLREKKGMTEAEINEAVKRAGVTDAPLQGRHVVPMQGQHGEGGVSVVTAIAGGVGLAAAAVAAYYGYQHWSRDEKKKKKKKTTGSAKKSESKLLATPLKSGKRDAGKGKEEVDDDGSDDDVKQVKDIQAGFESAMQAQADQYTKRMQEGIGCFIRVIVICF